MTGIGIPPVPRPWPKPPDHDEMERLDPGMTNIAVAMIEHYKTPTELVKAAEELMRVAMSRRVMSACLPIEFWNAMDKIRQELAKVKSCPIV